MRSSSVCGLAAEVDLQRTPQDQRARGLVERLALHQHPANVGVDEQGVGLGVGIARFGLQRAPLAAVLRVGDRILIGDLGLRETLQPDAEPGRVHHDEHRRQPLFGLADQIAGRPVVIHHAGRIAVDPHLMLDRAAGHRVALPDRAILADQELGHDEQRDALHIVGRAGDLGEDEVDDVVGQVVLARRDEDLGAGDRVAAVVLRLGLGLDQAEVGAAMRLGQVHRPGPAARDHVGQIFGLLLVRALDQRSRRSRPGSGHCTFRSCGWPSRDIRKSPSKRRAAGPGRQIPAAPTASSSRWRRTGPRLP